MEAKREKWIDLVKVIAIFIVLLNHANVHIMGVNFWGGMFYVPVFFVLSGYTYRTKEEPFTAYIWSKARRLLIPYFKANAILLAFFVCKEQLLDHQFTSVSVGSVLGIFYARNQLFQAGHEANVYFYQFLNSPTWFLPALFLAVILFDGLMRIWKNKEHMVAISLTLLFVVQIIYHYICPVLLPWSVDSIPLFALLIEIGYCLNRYHIFDRILAPKNLSEKLMLEIASIVFIAVALWNGSANLSIAAYGKSVLAAFYNASIASVLICYICYCLERRLKEGIPSFLTTAGKHTLTILCYHMLVFFFLMGGVNLALFTLGLSTNVYLMNAFKLCAILFTMALFTRIGERKSA